MQPTELNILVDTYRKFIRRGAKRQISNMFLKTHTADTAVLFRHFSQKERIALFNEMSAEYAAEVLRELDETLVVELLTQCDTKYIVEILKYLPSDDEADILGILPEELSDEILNLMKEEETNALEELLKYDPSTAGGLMTTQYFALKEETTAKEAISALQESEDAEMAFYLYVIDDRNHLIGVVSLRQLVTNPPNKTLSDIMNETPISVTTDIEQGEVAKLVSRYNIIAIPVVDKENKLLGIITIDDVVDVIREEATEDFFRMAGAGKDREILLKSTFGAAKLRFPWLLATWFGGIIASIIIGVYKDLLTNWIVLAAYMPIIVGMGGNIGTQSSTIIVRGLATGRVTLKSTWSILFKEMRIGVLLGLTYGILLTIVASYFYDANFTIGVAAGLGILASMALATITGTLAPIILHKFNIDPAVAAGPFVTTSIDILGIAIYLIVASYMLS
ncbi:MAG: magnesium transporter [Candidatus Marinimicrobia bacterium]|nr:magnesium transporter [Candidatus Neomarinimicrobiota bacterium]